jgi:hypothetical protein
MHSFAVWHWYRIFDDLVTVHGSVIIMYAILCMRRSRWLRSLRRGSAANRLLGVWVRIPPEAWLSLPCDCCVLPGRGLCDGLSTRPDHSTEEEISKLTVIVKGDKQKDLSH